LALTASQFNDKLTVSCLNREAKSLGVAGQIDSNVTVNVIEPGTLYGDRINQLDVRVSKALKQGRTRTVVGADIYNVLNSSAVLTYNNTYVPDGPWLQPLTILTPRFLKVTAEFDW